MLQSSQDLGIFVSLSFCLLSLVCVIRFLCTCSGTISTTSLLDRLFGRMISLARGELTDDIYDHQCSEYVRIFKQVIINARVPLGDKAVTAVSEVLDALVLKVCVCVSVDLLLLAISSGDRRCSFYIFFFVSTTLIRSPAGSVE